MKLIIGLGNPGDEYVKTRHNAGFMVVDRLAKRFDLTGDRSKFHALMRDGLIREQRCLLLKPMTFMNRSGLSVGEVMRFHKLSPQDLIIVVDDIALPAGAIRLRPDGGAGGHNGLTSIETALGSPQYPRLRIGVNAPGRIPQHDYVLGRFTATQWDAVDPAIDRACDCLEQWLTQPIEHVMSRFNNSETNSPDS